MAKNDLSEKYGASVYQNYKPMHDIRESYVPLADHLEAYATYKRQLELYAEDGALEYKPFAVLKSSMKTAGNKRRSGKRPRCTVFFPRTKRFCSICPIRIAWRRRSGTSPS
ncbi:hypothetical protein HMSSN036_27580 [Paenibacillus macerans]|nr:hypothetical protein HMSSN036_27580 [Paenibacillus macerans]